MKSKFWEELYNFKLSSNEDILDDYLKRNVINKQLFDNAQKYLLSKDLLLKQDNKSCIEYSKNEIQKTTNQTFKLLHHKLIADSYFLLGEYIKSHEHYLRAILLSNETENFNFNGSLYYSIALITAIFKQYDKTKFFLEKAVRYGIDYDEEFSNLLPYLEIYLHGKLKRSKKSLNKLEALLHNERRDLSNNSVVTIHIMISSLCEDFAMYQKMIKHNKTILFLKDKSYFLSYNHNMTSILKNLAYANFKLKNYKKTISYCEEAEEIIKDKKRHLVHHYLVFLKMDAMLALGRLNEAFQVFKLDAENYGSTVDTMNSNLQIMLDSFTNRLFAKETLLEKLDTLEKTKNILKIREKERQEFEQKSANFTPLKSFAREVYNENSINKFYHKVLLHLGKILKYDEFLIATFNDKKDLVFGELVISNNIILDKNTLPINFYPYLTTVIEEDTCILYNNASQEISDDIHGFGKDIIKVESLIACPLKDGNKIFGFSLIQSKDENLYKDSDLEVFKTFSYMLANKLSEFKTLITLKTEKNLLKDIEKNIENSLSKVEVEIKNLDKVKQEV